MATIPRYLKKEFMGAVGEAKKLASREGEATPLKQKDPLNGGLNLVT
jgi:hypothetical protein